MKNFLIIAFAIVITLMGCAKKQQGCTPVSPESEETQITAYASANNIAAVKHSSGMYYQIVNPGTGTAPNINSKVFINYTGKLLNNTVFEQSTDPSNTGWVLGSLIEGWQIGLPLIKKGGKIKLIIPSSLAYGCNGAGTSIPPNSVLFFDIDLVDVQ